MGTALRTGNGHIPAPAPAAGVVGGQRPAPGIPSLELARVFAATVLRHLLLVLPSSQRELARWRTLATAIPDPNLRETAARALRKRGNLEGAALFATLAPAANRRAAVRALVAFQTAYNYVDALSELPSRDPLVNGERLHQALLVALHPGVPHPDYYAHNPHGGDGGYLHAIVEACWEALADLPSYASVAPTARAAAARIVDFQALNLSETQGGHGALRRWASDVGPEDSGLAWWETAAGAGSSLAVHALIAAAADPNLDPREAGAIDDAYFPWIGALHTLLDSLVDRREDHESRQRSLLDYYYHSSQDAAPGLASLARRGRAAAECLANPYAHRVILTAMCSFYLSAPECHTAEGLAISRALRRTLGRTLGMALLMFGAKRLLHSITGRTYS